MSTAGSWRSLDTDSVATLVHSVVSRVGYCNASWRRRRKWQPPSCSKCSTPQLAWSAVQSTTEACRSSSIPTYIGSTFLSTSCASSASWRRTAVTVKRLAELCQLVAGVASRQHLRSTTRQHLVVPRYRLSIYAHRAFSVAGPSISNSLPDSLLDPVVGGNSFRQLLKTFLFSTYWRIHRIRGSSSKHYTNLHFPFLLTWFCCPSSAASVGLVHNRQQQHRSVSDCRPWLGRLNWLTAVNARPSIAHLPGHVAIICVICSAVRATNRVQIVFARPRDSHRSFAAALRCRYAYADRQHATA